MLEFQWENKLGHCYFELVHTLYIPIYMINIILKLHAGIYPLCCSEYFYDEMLLMYSCNLHLSQICFCVPFCIK